MLCGPEAGPFLVSQAHSIAFNVFARNAFEATCESALLELDFVAGAALWGLCAAVIPENAAPAWRALVILGLHDPATPGNHACAGCGLEPSSTFLCA